MTVKIDKVAKGKNDTETLNNIVNYLNQLADRLNYVLNNIDEKNMTSTYNAKRGD